MQSLSSLKLVDVLKAEYTHYFIKPIAKDEVDSLNLVPAAKKSIFTLKDNQYIVSLIAKKLSGYEDKIKTIVTDEESAKKTITLIKRHTMNDDETKSKITNDMPYVAEIINKEADTMLPQSRLSPSGKVAAIVYVKSITGNSLDMSIWVPIDSPHTFNF